MNNLEHFLAHKAYLLRVNSLKMTTQAGSGHPTSALSAADIGAVLFFYAMHFDVRDPENPNNDRFILSKGHASPLFYAIYKELGVLTEHDLMTYRSIDSVLEGHPTARFAWTEAATGSLGQGLSIGVGMALNAKLDKRSYYTYVLLGDGEMAEGSVWEAFELASYNKLDNLVAIIDVNRLGQTGQTMEGHHIDEFAERFKAFGWEPFTVYGHDICALITVFDEVKKVKEKPSVIIAKTYKGYGIDGVQDKNGYHGKAFSKQELPSILKKMAERFADDAQASDYPWKPKLPKKESLPSHQPLTLKAPEFKVGDQLPTRKAFGDALLQLGIQSDRIISLDGEVKNSTYAEYFADKFPNRFVQSFIAEQNMVGMAIGFEKRGKIPFVSTFGAFFSRAFDQIRMAAIGRAALRLVGSHAGVSIGQDGPSQMALEDIAIMRTLIGSVVFYPSDATSAWKLVGLMATYDEGITYLRTTRMATPIIYEAKEDFHVGGCKVLKQSNKDQACLVAAGVTLFEALKAHEQLKAEGIYTSVIDLYCIKPLDGDTLKTIVNKSKKNLITIEDHYAAGGIGEAVVDCLKNECIKSINLCVKKLPRSGMPEELLAFEEIDARAIVKAVKELA